MKKIVTFFFLLFFFPSLTFSTTVTGYRCGQYFSWPDIPSNIWVEFYSLYTEGSRTYFPSSTVYSYRQIVSNPNPCVQQDWDGTQPNTEPPYLEVFYCSGSWCVAGKKQLTSSEALSYSYPQDCRNIGCPDVAVWGLYYRKESPEGCIVEVWKDKTGKCGSIAVLVQDCSNPTWDSPNVNATMYACIDVSQNIEVPSNIVYRQGPDWCLEEKSLSSSYTYQLLNYPDCFNSSSSNFTYNEMSFPDYNNTIYAGSSGVNGSASIENATLSDVASFLSAIQANTATTDKIMLSQLEQSKDINKMLSNIYHSLSSLSSSDLSILKSNTASIDKKLSQIRDMLSQNASVSPLTSDDFDVNIDIPSKFSSLDNATYGNGVSSFIDDLPILSALRSSSVQLDTPQCSLSTTIYGSSVNFNFCTQDIQNWLSLMGNIIYAVSVFYFFFIVFTF